MRSVAVQLRSKQENCQGALERNGVQWRVSGYSWQQDLSWEQCPAKTMTSLLILPALLAKVVLINDLAELVLGAVSIFLFYYQAKMLILKTF